MAWTKEHPKSAMFMIIFAYIVCLVFLIPTVFLHLLAGYIYARATGDQLEGLLIAVTVAFIGT